MSETPTSPATPQVGYCPDAIIVCQQCRSRVKPGDLRFTPDANRGPKYWNHLFCYTTRKAKSKDTMILRGSGQDWFNKYVEDPTQCPGYATLSGEDQDVFRGLFNGLPRATVDEAKRRPRSAITSSSNLPSVNSNTIPTPSSIEPGDVTRQSRTNMTDIPISIDHPTASLPSVHASPSASIDQNTNVRSDGRGAVLNSSATPISSIVATSERLKKKPSDGVDEFAGIKKGSKAHGGGAKTRPEVKTWSQLGRLHRQSRQEGVPNAEHLELFPAVRPKAPNAPSVLSQETNEATATLADKDSCPAVHSRVLNPQVEDDSVEVDPAQSLFVPECHESPTYLDNSMGLNLNNWLRDTSDLDHPAKHVATPDATEIPIESHAAEADDKNDGVQKAAHPGDESPENPSIDRADGNDNTAMPAVVGVVAGDESAPPEPLPRTPDTPAGPAFQAVKPLAYCVLYLPVNFGCCLCSGTGNGSAQASISESPAIGIFDAIRGDYKYQHIHCLSKRDLTAIKHAWKSMGTGVKIQDCIANFSALERSEQVQLFKSVKDRKNLFSHPDAASHSASPGLQKRPADHALPASALKRNKDSHEATNDASQSTIMNDKVNPHSQHDDEQDPKSSRNGSSQQKENVVHLEHGDEEVADHQEMPISSGEVFKMPSVQTMEHIRTLDVCGQDHAFAAALESISAVDKHDGTLWTICWSVPNESDSSPSSYLFGLSVNSGDWLCVDTCKQRIGKHGSLKCPAYTQRQAVPRLESPAMMVFAEPGGRRFLLLCGKNAVGKIDWIYIELSTGIWWKQNPSDNKLFPRSGGCGLWKNQFVIFVPCDTELDKTPCQRICAFDLKEQEWRTISVSGIHRSNSPAQLGPVSDISTPHQVVIFGDNLYLFSTASNSDARICTLYHLTLQQSEDKETIHAITREIKSNVALPNNLSYLQLHHLNDSTLVLSGYYRNSASTDLKLWKFTKLSSQTNEDQDRVITDAEPGEWVELLIPSDLSHPEKQTQMVTVYNESTLTLFLRPPQHAGSDRPSPEFKRNTGLFETVVLLKVP